MFYDILTFLTTRIVMGYTTFPFVLLEFMVRWIICLTPLIMFEISIEHFSLTGQYSIVPEILFVPSYCCTDNYLYFTQVHTR